MAKKEHLNRSPAKVTIKNVPEPAQVFFALRYFWCARILLIIAAITTAYLLRHALSGGSISGCGAGSGCDRVLGSPWAYCLGIPVSAPALLVYFALIGASFFITRSKLHRTLVWLILIGLAFATIGAGLWFTGLQIWQLKSLCKFCAFTHGCAATGALLLLSRAPIRFRSQATSSLSCGREMPFLQASISALCGLVAVMALIGLQYIFPFRSNLVKIHDGQIQIDTLELPLIGAVNAPYKIISLFDYTCPHCQELHHLLHLAQERFHQQFAIVALPAPLDAECNPVVKVTPRPHRQACEFARLGLALWRADPQAFLKFDRLIFGELPHPSLEQARKYAIDLIGEARLANSLKDEWIEKTLKIGLDIYAENGRQTGSFKMPQLMVGRVVNTGTLPRLEDLLSLLQTNLALKTHL